MDSKAAAALEGSIKKWRKIADGTGVDEGESNCPLCIAFLHVNGHCAGCPVAVKTGKPYCSGSPYSDYRLALLFGRPQDELLRQAQREVDFLISLREPQP